MQDTINRIIFNNHFVFDIRVGSGSIVAASLIRSFRSLANKPEYLALEHINSEKPTTSLLINKLLLNQNLSVTESKLEELLNVKGVELDFPISTPDDKILLDVLAGKSKYKGFSGVYVFIHKSTGHKYVGSSNLLRRRMDYFFLKEISL